ncbi:uncharacterized protein DEA37_0003311 [Paragonimus westermani]|uniref:Uncharacterized protein n=1 Tax=Paragonimus westermani TaxID=34504 RepID=A0A5J4NX49_9TREM|nr:uncharacterized protein DEA37_0003311 [Paragonimus westermani]
MFQWDPFWPCCSYFVLVSAPIFFTECCVSDLSKQSERSYTVVITPSVVFHHEVVDDHFPRKITLKLSHLFPLTDNHLNLVLSRDLIKLSSLVVFSLDGEQSYEHPLIKPFLFFLIFTDCLIRIHLSVSTMYCPSPSISPVFTKTVIPNMNSDIFLFVNVVPSKSPLYTNC